MIDAELDLCPADGWSGGPEFYTRVVTLRNGHERRNAMRVQMQHRFTLPFQDISDADYLLHLKAVFAAALGRAESFLAKDWSDFEVSGEAIGNAPSGSTPVQLTKTYQFGPSTYTRDITKPVSAGLVVYQDGVAKPGIVDIATGMFTPTTDWTAGLALTWSGEFRVPVRFASDALNMSIDSRSDAIMQMNGSVELVEVFGE